MAVKNGRVLAIGNDVSDHVGPKTQVLDLRGAAVVPGFIDSHVHMEGLGMQMETFDLRHVKTVAEVAALVRKRAAQLPKGTWIRGRSWDQTNWGGAFPTEAALTAAAPEHPVFLTRVDGHAGWVNRKALEIAGIDEKTPDPMGGKIVRDAAGRATGILIDRAQGLVGAKIPPASDDEVVSRIRAAARECARLGLTTVHDAGIDEQDLRAYRKLLAAGQLPVRVYAMIGGDGAMWRRFLESGPEIHERLTIRSIKLMADGAMGSRGAAFWQPYADDPGNTGLMLLKQETVERVARQAVEKGFQVNTHAIGDRANRMVLDAYGKVLVRAQRRVADRHPHPFEWHVQLLGHQLMLHRPEPLAKVALPGKRRHRAVGADRDPGVHLPVGPPPRLRLHRKAHQQRARQPLPPCHARFSRAYRTSARTIRGCA